jgi:nitrite reductase/ring-hydroxylating ferredoxin subunit
MAFVKVGSLGELPAGTVAEAVVDGNPYALCNLDGEIHALWGTCPHAHGPLGQGHLQGSSLFCPWHEWAFDCRTGRHEFLESACVQRFAVRVENGDILMDPEKHA